MPDIVVNEAAKAFNIVKDAAVAANKVKEAAIAAGKTAGNNQVGKEVALGGIIGGIGAALQNQAAQETIKKTAEVAAETAAKTAAGITIKAAVGTAAGTLLGPAASQIAVNSAKGLAGLIGKAVQECGYKGFERGQEFGKAELLRSIQKEIKEASLITMGSYINSLIVSNPKTKLIRDICLVGGTGYGCAKLIQFASSQLQAYSNQAALRLALRSKINERIQFLFVDKSLTLAAYNELLKELAYTNDPKTLTVLLEKVLNM